MGTSEAVAVAEDRLDELVREADEGEAAEREVADLVGGLLASARSRGAASTVEIMVRFPLLVGVAAGGDLATGRDAAVVHVLWWTAARYLDDLADDDGRTEPATDPHRGVLAAIGAGNQMPLRVLAAAPVAADVRIALIGELTRCWSDASTGQLFDYSARPAEVTPTEVLAAYGGRTGAPYGMAAAMAARLAGADDDLAARWREAGRRFGVLRQLVSDQRDLVTGRDEKLRNRTATLLLTTYLAETGDHRALMLPVAELKQRLLAHADGYQRRVDALVRALHGEFDALTGDAGPLHDLLDEAMAVFPLPVAA
jgi:geranylgeranyl pyrophosphate synthase